MKNKEKWITMAIINLGIVALLGFLLRSKILFPIPFIDFKNLLSAHSHFAFGGWITLILMVLLIERFLDPLQKNKRFYQVILWGIQLCSLGMLFSFPFGGYQVFSIIFSTSFILFTYAFTWRFLKDIRAVRPDKSILLLVTCALLSLVISSAGPFSLAYMMATNTGSATNARDSIYFFLHFQYNGFFTLTVFSLLFRARSEQWQNRTKKNVFRFVLTLCLSIVPSFFLSLLWHAYNPLIRTLSYLGFVLLILCVVFFISLVILDKKLFLFGNRLANTLLRLSMFAFVIKIILQTGTIIPDLGNAVFGFRPIIIGFLHLVFLGLVTLYIFSDIIDSGLIAFDRITRISIVYFTSAIIFNESVLAINGIGLLFKITHPVYDWLLWGASILLFTSALLIVIARVRLNDSSIPLKYRLA